MTLDERDVRRRRSARWLASTLAAGQCAYGIAAADGVAFDRAGIAFSPSTLPARSYAWEQGLPDFQRDRADGVTQRAYAASSRFRAGLTDALELQLAAPLFEEIDTSGSGRGFTAAGMGDLSLALKASLPTGNAALGWAVLANVSVPTARSDLGAGALRYSLGTTIGWTFAGGSAAALYGNVDVLQGHDTWTVSPNYSFGLSDTVGAYLEAGFQFGGAHGAPPNDVAGGGLTWMVRPTVQLDLYGLTGLTRASTDLAAGCGISLFFH